MIKRFLRAWRETELMRQYDFSAADDAWTQEDSLRLSALFESDTGLRLKARLINFRARCAIEATRTPDNTIFHSGIAHGVALTIAEIEAGFARPLRSGDNIEQELPSSVAHLVGIT